jgi:hypothetical protein
MVGGLSYTGEACHHGNGRWSGGGRKRAMKKTLIPDGLVQCVKTGGPQGVATIMDGYCHIMCRQTCKSGTFVTL